MTIDKKTETDVYLANLIKTPSCAKYATATMKFNQKSIAISGLSILATGAYLGILI